MRVDCLLLATLLVSACSSESDEQVGAEATVAQQVCAAMSGMNLSDGRVTSVSQNVTGRFEIEDPGPNMPAVVDELPPFCHLSLVANPVPESRIGVEVWLPADNWNGRLLMIGNGGYSSSIAWFAMADGVRKGFAMVATDTGHDGDDPEFARGHPQRIEDWAWRAVHEAVRLGEQVATEAYGIPPRFRYFAGCSTGGHQALKSAQKFPDDFDGIVAGAPGHNRTHLNAGFLWQFLQNHEREAPHEEILPAAKLPLLNEAVLAKCGVQNGGERGGLKEDTWLNDPFACDFDPGELRCGNDVDNPCLSEAETEAARAIYAGPTNPRTGERIYFGQLPGSEVAGGPPNGPGWSLYWADPASPGAPARASFWQIWALRDDEWDWWAFDFDADMVKTDDRLADIVNAMRPNLEEFSGLGGKLLHYHGLNDAVVPATDSVHYYERVRRTHNGEISDFYRLYLAPGVHHCRGGPGADRFDMLGALVAWVEEGHTPDRIVAAKYQELSATGEPVFERPLCPYPKRAIYDGSHDKSSAQSFVCREAEPYLELPELGKEYLR